MMDRTLHQPGRDGGAMSVDETSRPQANTCVLLAPPDVEVGKHVTDAVRAGGWSLARATSALDAMLMLCRLEQAQRDAGRFVHGKHMLLIHRDFGPEVSTDLTLAVRKHLPGVKVHEIEGRSGAGDDADRAVVGRIGRSVTAATIASKVMSRGARSEQAEDHDGGSAEGGAVSPADLDVTRDEIAMLLSDETGLEPRLRRGPSMPGAGSGDGR